MNMTVTPILYERFIQNPERVQIHSVRKRENRVARNASHVRLHTGARVSWECSLLPAKSHSSLLFSILVY